jgi:hypothetical protein
MKNELSKTEQPCTLHSVNGGGLLFNQFERETIRKYNGIWGWQTPDYAPSIIIRYNSLKIQKELIRVLRVRQIVKWLSNHLP